LGDLDEAARRVGRGDARAFRALVDATGDRLYRLALRMTGDADDARDVVQDAYVQAHRALSKGHWKGESKVETWLYRIVLNTAINHRRGRGRRAALLGQEQAPSPTPERGAEIARLMEGVLSLPPEQRAVVVLKELEGHTSAEIGTMLGCTEGAVEQRLLRARANLRRRLGDE
jgi:RNA polymerase sigma-70 factor, ECF subfamily